MAGYCEKKDPLEFSTEIEKWDQETPADGKEMAKPIEKLYNNTEYNKKGVEDVKNPEFDASGNASGITNFQKLIDSITSKMSIFSFFANLKTGLKYVLDVGKIVNNGTTTEAGKFVLDAIQANPNIAGTLAKQIQENASAISSLNARVVPGYKFVVIKNHIIPNRENDSDKLSIASVVPNNARAVYVVANNLIDSENYCIAYSFKSSDGSWSVRTDGLSRGSIAVDILYLEELN